MFKCNKKRVDGEHFAALKCVMGDQSLTKQGGQNRAIIAVSASCNSPNCANRTPSRGSGTTNRNFNRRIWFAHQVRCAPPTSRLHPQNPTPASRDPTTILCCRPAVRSRHLGQPPHSVGYGLLIVCRTRELRSARICGSAIARLNKVRCTRTATSGLPSTIGGRSFRSSASASLQTIAISTLSVFDRNRISACVGDPGPAQEPWT